MPLKLIKHVLPWLIGTMNDEEAERFLDNFQLAGSSYFLYDGNLFKRHVFTVTYFSNNFYANAVPASDTGLVNLFCNWAGKVGKQDLCSSSSARSSSPTVTSCNGHILQNEHHYCCFPGLAVTNKNFNVSSLSAAKPSFLLASPGSSWDYFNKFPLNCVPYTNMILEF